MALAKNIKSPFGLMAAYHMIASMQINSRDMSATVQVASYLSAATRAAEKDAILSLKDAANSGDETALAIARGKLAENQPMMSVEVGIPTEVFNALVAADDGDLLRASVYAHLKTLPRFGGSEDV